MRVSTSNESVAVAKEKNDAWERVIITLCFRDYPSRRPWPKSWYKYLHHVGLHSVITMEHFEQGSEPQLCRWELFLPNHSFHGA
jgi:hypothetical protein